jgi:hypothetical protein
MSIFQRRVGSFLFDPQPTKASEKRDDRETGTHDRETGTLEVRGRITYCDSARHLFILQPEDALPGVGGDLLCSLGADLRPTLPMLSHLLIADQWVRVVGTHVVPSVYKPFEFEVTRLARFQPPQ